MHHLGIAGAGELCACVKDCNVNGGASKCTAARIPTATAARRSLLTLLGVSSLRSLTPCNIYHYTIRTFVRAYEREVTGSHLTRAKKFLFLGIARLGRYN